jgi:hypothetical protein
MQRRGNVSSGTDVVALNNLLHIPNEVQALIYQAILEDFVFIHIFNLFATCKVRWNLWQNGGGRELYLQLLIERNTTLMNTTKHFRHFKQLEILHCYKLSLLLRDHILNEFLGEGSVSLQHITRGYFEVSQLCTLLRKMELISYKNAHTFELNESYAYVLLTTNNENTVSCGDNFISPFFAKSLQCVDEYLQAVINASIVFVERFVQPRKPTVISNSFNDVNVYCSMCLVPLGVENVKEIQFK